MFWPYIVYKLTLLALELILASPDPVFVMSKGRLT